ncbi:unnamed protein product [Brugia timori]|uniref:WD_REPEATS_REGION domain-containing protein n=1 Tax=Brugia timori TaxID=42155 RepID=A0A0R3Q5W3_9BILA|nr:unnamed protein product [Brugia timori]
MAEIDRSEDGLPSLDNIYHSTRQFSMPETVGASRSAKNNCHNIDDEQSAEFINTCIFISLFHSEIILINKVNKMKASDRTVASMRPAKSFSDNQAPINSLDFSADGLQMISSSDDDSIIMYDCVSGQKSRSVNSKKYGVDLIQFAHNTSNAIHCSTKVDGQFNCSKCQWFTSKSFNFSLCFLDVIRYLSLHDNKYIRYFPGHQKKVVTLCMSPLDDMFLSGSLDKTIRLWDLRIQSCQGLMHVPSRPVAAFDPEGLIFAAGINSDTIKLYDLRSFDKVRLNFLSIFPEEQKGYMQWFTDIPSTFHT